MPSLEILAITSLMLGAFMTGTIWARRRAQAERHQRAEEENRPLARIRHLDGGDKRLLEQVAEIFTTQGRSDLNAMHQALHQGDASQLAQRAHRLGGSAEYLGNTALSALCAEIEDLAREGEIAGCRPRLQALEEEFKRIIAELPMEATQIPRD